MNMNTLNYIIAIAEEGSFTKAAKRLFISQPTLSQSVQQLERQLGAKLFDRSSTPIVLTRAGEEYLSWAKSVIDSEAQTLRRISDIVQNRNRNLVVGISPYRSLRYLPVVLERFYEETKGDCKVTLVEQRSSEYMRIMEEGTLDLLIDKPVSDDSPYEAITLTEEQILVAVPCRYRLPAIPDGVVENIGMPNAPIRCEVTELESLRNKPVIMLTQKQHMGRAWRQVFETMGEAPKVVLECQSIDMAYVMVRQGLGLTLIPESLIRFLPPTENVCYYKLKNYPLSRMMAVLYPKHRYLSQDARRFIELLQEVTRKQESFGSDRMEESNG